MRITGLKKYKYKYDLHVHTSPVSPCADFSPEETVRRYKDAGFNGFVLTNHFTPFMLSQRASKEDFISYYLNDYYKTVEAGEKFGLDIILGMEIRFPENTNDYLIYGITEDDVRICADFLSTDYKTFYRGFKSPDNIIIQAHPFRNNIVLADLDYIDGIEVYNMHPGHNSRIGIVAQLVSENPRLLVTGGTDFHHEGHEGMCALCSEGRIRDSFDMAKVIASRDFIFDVWGNKIIPTQI